MSAAAQGCTRHPASKGPSEDTHAADARAESCGTVLQAMDSNHTPQPRLRCMVAQPAGSRPSAGGQRGLADGSALPKPGAMGSAPSPRRSSQARTAASPISVGVADAAGSGGGSAAALRAAQLVLAARLASEGRVWFPTALIDYLRLKIDRREPLRMHAARSLLKVGRARCTSAGDILLETERRACAAARARSTSGWWGLLLQ